MKPFFIAARFVFAARLALFSKLQQTQTRDHSSHTGEKQHAEAPRSHRHTPLEEDYETLLLFRKEKREMAAVSQLHITARGEVPKKGRAAV